MVLTLNGSLHTQGLRTSGAHRLPGAEGRGVPGSTRPAHTSQAFTDPAHGSPAQGGSQTPGQPTDRLPGGTPRVIWHRLRVI